jgi:hypothetical protein
MAPFEKIDGGAGLDQKQDLGRLVYVVEIRDGLLDSVIEHLKVTTMETPDEIPVLVGYDHAHVDTVNDYANVR